MSEEPMERSALNEGKGSETSRAIVGFLLGLTLGAIVGLLSKRKPDR